jgi:hypothetical protein
VGRTQATQFLEQVQVGSLSIPDARPNTGRQR